MERGLAAAAPSGSDPQDCNLSQARSKPQEFNTFLQRLVTELRKIRRTRRHWRR
jgi:hypothetical protein